MNDPNHVRMLGRRTFLLASGATLVAACSGSDNADDPVPEQTTTSASTASPPPSVPAEPDGAATAPLTAAMFDALAVCALTPSAAEGPFPTSSPIDRRDITDGVPGHPLRLGLRVVDEQCRAVPGAVVDIWHADATGDYSEYTDNGSGKDEGAGTTFCRGAQTCDADGIVEFLTVYPGWYEGRAVHIHVTVRIDGDRALTSQLYFDEAYSSEVYTREPYAQFGDADTSWAEDRLIGDPDRDGTGISLTAGPTTLGTGTLGLVNLGV